MYFIAERIGRILEELDGYRFTDTVQVRNFFIKPCEYGDFSPLQEDAHTWEAFPEDGKWGGKDLHCWFKVKAVIPAGFQGRCVTLEIKTGTENVDWDAVNPQFLVYVDGAPVQGLDVNHRRVVLSECAEEGAVYDVAFYAYSGMKERKAGLSATLSAFDRETDRLYYHIKVPLEVAALLDKEDKRRCDILNYLTHAVNLLDLRKPQSEAYHDSVAAASRYLDEEFYGNYCCRGDVIETCVGQTHIDVAWLWTVAQAREKAARSFSTVLSLMKHYPDYVFMCSQPQLYQFVKEDHPEIYEQIKARIAEGRWEAEGAMWLEADCNLTSGESLVRQIVYGKRFFREEFGVDSKILWLPDAFGYSAALPQILKKSGVKYFMTTKISWNDYNKLPCDTFLWRGIDGSEVLTHFITTRDYEKDSDDKNQTTYNGDTNPSQVMGCWQRYQHKDFNNEVLNCFGYGDGGGGPTREMLENIARLEKGIPGAPTVRQGTALDYFKRLEKRVSGSGRLPGWVGELYFEYHRGTYTSMARNKRYNRTTEFLNLDAELFATMCATLDPSYIYPHDTLRGIWETTLLNQFHDILPGSSIREVYEDSKRDYERIDAAGREIVRNAQKMLSSNIRLERKSAVVFNSLGITGNGAVSVPLPAGWQGAKVLDGGHELPVQAAADGNFLFYAADIPPKGYKCFTLEQAENIEVASGVRVSASAMSNRFFDITLDGQANITSILDKRCGRQVLQAGERANVLQAFEDKPSDFDAWNIDIYYMEKMWEVSDVTSVHVLEQGPVRGCLEITRPFLDSVIVQRVYIYNDIPRVDFATRIDWKEKQILLKAAFPVDVHADKATYEIQYGNAERLTHWNTSWDYARFEVCAHKWADLSEDGYGVSLLNDCKYGHDIKDSVMRLTLLKSAADPNEDADRELHEFTYSLYPHVGGWREGGTVPMAYALNCPLHAAVEDAHEGTLPTELSFLQTDCENVVVEVVKQAEEQDGTVLRLYECYNRRSKVTVRTLQKLAAVQECDLLENGLGDIPHLEHSFTFEIKPYEIKTFLLK